MPSAFSSVWQKREEVKKEQERIAFEARQKEYCEAEQKRWTIVSASQIEVRDPSLKPWSSRGPDEEYTVSASIKNKSKSKVTALILNLTALDCPAQNARISDCDVVGRDDKTFYSEIPTGEVRQIDGRIKLRDVPKPRGVFSSRFAVKSVRAAIDQSDDTSGVLERWVYQCN